MTPRLRILTLVLVPLATMAASPYVPWEDLTEADWLFPLATRIATVEGQKVHYPTPTRELVAALETRSETAALRHLAEARRDLGDTPGALTALEKWAGGEGAEAWAESARWAAARGEWAFAFRAAEKALPGLPLESARVLQDERIGWAERAPGFVDSIALREARARAFPQNARAANDFIRALERAGRIEEAEAAVRASASLPRERRILLASDLAADHGEFRRAQQILDASLDEAVSPGSDVARAFADRTDKASPDAPESWRASLDRSFDARALVRLATYFEGKERGDAALDLLRQVERRHSAAFDRAAWLLVARLYQEIDAVPEAFRARLAAASGAAPAEQQQDLGALASLALAAGGRPLPFGLMSDAHYAWVAAMDRTPGFWTGGLSFLLTGQDWRVALDQIESESLPERTFATARLLVDELARRSPSSPDLPALRAALMRRHVERGEGEKALSLLSLAEGGPADSADEARKQALLAMRQVERPIGEESRLLAARLRHLAPDGSRPVFDEPATETGYLDDSPSGQAWTRYYSDAETDRYGNVLDEALERLDQRDRSHGAALVLMLAEMDRLPDAEALWNRLADRLQGWNLDDDLGPRFEKALTRFDGPGIWPRLARWYARRSRSQELRRLADDLANRFRGAEVFARASADAALAIPEQPKVGARVRLVEWSDWVRLRALERFPHSPIVYREAARVLVARSLWDAKPVARPGNTQAVVADNNLLETRRAAILFVDAPSRESYFASAMQKGNLAARLAEMEKLPSRTPVEDRLLFEGWSRLSEFERAAPFAITLARQYPGDQTIAGDALSLLRSLVALRQARVEDARDIVESAARASLDPARLYTEFGEMELESGRPDAAVTSWKRILEREPGNTGAIENLATLLWDYERPAEAKAVIDEGRTRTGRPRLLAFEAGVLREQLKDIDGAVREYLASAEPDGASCFCSWFERDQRSLRRLAQLMARQRVLQRILATIEALQPGSGPAEETLVALLPLGRIEMPEEGLDFTADDWIDTMDAPNDPVARAARQAARKDWRPLAREGMSRVSSALFARSLDLARATTRTSTLDALERSSWSLLSGRTAEESFRFRAVLLERRAALAPTEEERVDREVARARFLLDGGKSDEADALWRSLAPRVLALPKGLTRLRAEAARAGFTERLSGAEAAIREWERLTTAYPWSLGILEDRLALLARSGRSAEGRAVLEKVAPAAARGHREALLERLTREALEARDLPQARRAVEALLATPDLPAASVLGGTHLLARLALREAPAADVVALIRTKEAAVPDAQRADLYAEAARGAVAERAHKTASDLFIEALNRRLERAWLREGYLASDHAERAPVFVAFFEKQQQRSPRDVRWAVAVRELRRLAGDVDGAMEMARVAVTVRPERESLWTEAADILVRAGRHREAADLLARWQETRPADADVASRRAALLVRAADPAAALAVERAALDAFLKAGPLDEERRNERDSRLAAMASRFLDLGLPQEGWKALAVPGETNALALDSLGAWDGSRLALAAGRFSWLLARKASEEEWRSGLANAVSTYASAGQKDEILRFLLEAISPHPTPPLPRRVSALRKYWAFADQAGLADPLRLALARRTLGATSGPWSPDPPSDFVDDVAALVVDPTPEDGPTLVDPTPQLQRLYVRELVRRDRSSELFALLEGRFSALAEAAQATTPLPPGQGRLPWAPWLDDPQAMEVFVRGVAADPARLVSFGALFAERRTWDRIWRLAAHGTGTSTAWPVHVVVAALPEESRAAWFRTWQAPSPSDKDPQLAARGRSIEASQRTLVKLFTGAPLAEDEAVLARLRGPRTVGDVLSGEEKWRFPEFALRKDASGQILDEGEFLVTGQRQDTLRIPGALWGDRPGTAWYALETLARLREKDPTAPLVPLEAPDRGRENEKLLLAMDAAAAGADPAQALALDRAASGVASPARLERRLALLALTGHKDDASKEFEAEVRRAQASLKEASFRSLRRLGEDVELGDATRMLDPAGPVDSALLAYLVDRHGPSEARALRPFDPAGFRSALSSRWRNRLLTIAPESLRYYLSEVWARDAAPLPSERALARLGPFWRASAPLLGVLPAEARAEGLAAVAALPDTALLDPLVRRLALESQESVLLLRLRLALASGRDEEARTLLAPVLDAATADRPLAWAPVEPLESSEDQELPDAEDAPNDARALGTDVDARLARWLAPFVEAKKVPLVADRIREVLSLLRERDSASVTLWRLSLLVAKDAAERDRFLAAMDRTWLAGTWTPENLGPLSEMVARTAPSAAGLWLERWNAGPFWGSIERKARILTLLDRKSEAAALLVKTRRTWGLTSENERQAFDAWRRLGPVPQTLAPPPDWVTAATFWTAKADAVGADLGRHLRAHPMDLLAARAALRTVAPGDPETMRLAIKALATLGGYQEGSGFDTAILRLRAARTERERSWYAGLPVLEGLDVWSLPAELEKRRFTSETRRHALADVVRVLDGANDTRRVEGLLAYLEDQSPDEARALRQELRQTARARAKVPTYRLEAGVPRPYRPRDVDWTVVSAVLAAEVAR